MTPERLLAHFYRIVDAPDAIPRLRKFILDLAVRGKLTPQDLTDEPASAQLKTIEQTRRRLYTEKKIPKPKPMPEIQDVELPFSVGQTWAWTMLGKLCYQISDGPHHSPNYVSADEGVPFLSTRNVRVDRFDLTDIKYISKEDHEKFCQRIRPELGDIIYTKDGTTGIARVNELDFQFSVWVHLAVLKIEKKLLYPQYVAMALNSPFCYQQSQVYTQGTSNFDLGLTRLIKILIPLPPLAEQHRILAKVDELMALCDRLEAAQVERESRRDRLAAASLHRLHQGSDADEFRQYARFHLQHLPRLTTRPEQISTLRKTILNLAILGKLIPQDSIDESASELSERIQAEWRRLATPAISKESETLCQTDEEPFALPIGWIWIKFGYLVLAADSGWSPRCEGFPREGANWGVIKVSAVSWDKFLPNENKQLLPGVIPPEETKIEKGDFLISRANTSELVAKSVIVEETPKNLILSDKIVRLKLTQHCNKRFVVMVNNHALHARAHYASQASGTSLSMKNVSRSVIYALPIPLPPLAEQHRIVAKVDELMTICDQLEAQLTTTQTESRRFLEAVLHEALSAA